MTDQARSHDALVVLGLGASRLRDAGTRTVLSAGAAEAARARGHGHVEVVEAPDGPAVRAACVSAVRDGVGLVVSVGGDGTVREAAAALSGSGIPLGIVPAGTGNLLASTLAIPRSPKAALAAVRAGSRRTIDHGEARWEQRDDPSDGPAVSPFVVAAGVGLDARFLAAVSPEAKRRYGIGAYLVAALGQASDLRPRPTALVVDGERHDIEAVVVLVANAGEIIPGVLGPRLPIRPDDGRLHVFVIRGGIVGSVVGGLELLAAGDTGWSATGRALRLSATSVRVEMGGQPPEPVEIDGDRVGTGALDARVCPGALDVLVPEAVGPPRA